MKKRFLISSLALFFGAMAVKAQTWEWAQKLEGTSGADQVVVKAVDTDPTGNSYVTGYYNGQFLSAASLTSDQQDGFVAKFDATGSLQWIYRFGGPGADAGNAISVETSTVNPCFYITGYVQYNDPSLVSFTGGTVTASLPLANSCVNAASPNNVFLRGGLSARQAFIAKYNVSGTLQWVRPMYAPGCLDAEGLGVCASYRHLNGAGYERNVYVTGYFEGNSMSFASSGACSFVTVNGNTNGRTAFVAKMLGTNGNVSWAKSLAVPGNTAASSVGKSVLVDFIAPSSANVLISGNFQNAANFTTATLTAAQPAAYVANVNGSGTYAWGTVFEANGPGASIDARDLSSRAGAGFTDMYAYGDFSGAQFSAGGSSYPNGGGRDLYFVMLNKTTGAVNYARTDGGADDQYAYGMDMSANGGASGNPEIYVSGAYNNSINFFGGSAFGNYGSSSVDHFMARYDLSLNYMCGTHWDGHLILGVNTIDACDVAASKQNANSSAYFGGMFQTSQSPVFSPITLTTPMPMTGFVSKWLCCECPPPTFTVNRVGFASTATVSFTYPQCDNSLSLFMLNYKLGGSSSTVTVTWGTPNVVITGLAPTAYQWVTVNNCQLLSAPWVGRTTSVGNNGDIDKPFKVYPNPTDNSLSIETMEPGSAELYDMSGRLVLTKKIGGDNTKEEINVSGIANGSYLLKYISDSGVTTSKIQIMH